MSKLGIIFAFALGAAAGTAVTWKVLKSKYERIAQEEIDSVKEVYSKKYGEDKTEVEAKVEKEPKVDATADATTIVRNLGYSTFSENTVVNEKKEKTSEPYVIAPEDFDEIGYETSSLTYFADKVLVDDMNQVVTDIDTIIGPDALNSFGEYEDDSVFVRNDALKTDFEILLDMRNYSDLESKKSIPLSDDE